MEFSTWIRKRIAGEDVSLGLPKEQQNLNGLILEEAIAFHIAWRERWTTALREHREDEFDAAQVSNDTLCQVGEWIYNEGKSLAKYPEYERFRELHAKFHQCAGTIVVSHQKGHFMEALATIKNELMPLSEEVGLSLGELLEASKR